MRSAILAVAVLLPAFTGSGCVYLEARALDFQDCFHFTVDGGIGASARL